MKAVTCPIVPLGDRVVIKQNEAVYEGAVVLPDSVLDKEKSFRGKIVAVGPGMRAEFTGNTIPMPNVEVGDEVVYSKYGGTEVELDDITYLVIRAADVIGVVAA